MGILLSVLGPVSYWSAPVALHISEHKHDHRSASETIFAVCPVVELARGVPLPERYRGSQALVRAEGGARMHGRAYALADWDESTGQAVLRAEKWGTAVGDDGPQSFNATGVFFDGSHMPNGTIAGFAPDGELVNGHWLVVEQAVAEQDGSNDWMRDREAVESFMAAFPEYFA